MPGPASRVRFRQFLSVAAGLDLWLMLVGVPMAHRLSSADSSHILLVAAALPLVLLLAGVARRSQALLLLAFPVSLALAILLEPSLAGPRVHTVSTVLAATGAFILHAACALLAVASPPPPPDTERRLPPALAAAVPARVRRFQVLMLLSAILFPAALFGAIHLRPGAWEDLGRAYGTAAPAARAFLSLVALALWAGLFFVYVVPTLTVHLDGDRATAAELMETKRRVATAGGRTGMAFVLAAAAALMAAFLWLRYR